MVNYRNEKAPLPTDCRYEGESRIQEHDAEDMKNLSCESSGKVTGTSLCIVAGQRLSEYFKPA
jgi:hypothetical protein